MKRYAYKAKEQGTGKSIKGTIQAENERAAGKLLVDRGYIPDSLKEEGGGVGAKLNKVQAADRINFTRQFATLIGAGLPLAQSLRTVAEQTSSAPMKTVIEQVLADIEAGRSLGDAFGKHPDIFNNVYMSLIRAGEVSGTLDNSLKRIADQEEKDAKIAASIKGAMTYPIIAVLVLIAVFVYMMIEIVPEVENLYNSLGEELPGITQALVGIKNFIMGYWYIALAVIAGIVILFRQFAKTDVGTRFFALFKLNVPAFGPLFRLQYMARFTRISQILLSTGVSILDTLNIAATATNNIIVEESINQAAEKVQQGKPLSEALRDRDYILPLVYQMAAIGEQSGKMSDMLGKAAQVYEDELDEKVAALSTILEPIMLIGLGGMAGVLVAGVLLPIYSIVNSIGCIIPFLGL